MIVAVTDRGSCRHPFLEQIGRIAEAGPDAIILREKDLTETEYSRLAAACMGICSEHGVEFRAHSFIGVAQDLGIGSMHLPMGILRENGRPRGMTTVGASVHSIGEAVEASVLGADYITFGHVFETSCKPGSAPRGLTALKEVCRISRIPVLAIGGISPDNAGDVMDCGPAGICLMSSLMDSEDPSELLTRLRRISGV